ncbi:major royal jelly protein 1-like isoform X2 [Photinus pyralis]|uniref:major royal jelly protein 1-like isoform X2 n=1 Tax=Photinus pyralis TaxID=7054 RepID=UPI00126748FB|nr:major royal jelly protein 1-like isoform X2 [Photinus pyralis]
MTAGYWFCCVLGFLLQTNGDIIRPVYEWINVEYDYPSLDARKYAIGKGEFVKGASRISDVDVHYFENNTRRVFVTTPRLANGVPATLGVVLDRTYEGNPIIAPYPSWQWNSNVSSCPRDRIVSVFRIMVDSCERGSRLWVMDSGFTSSYKCPPQVLAFDLETDSLIHRYEIPPSQLQSTSVLAVVLADVRNPSCTDTFIYIGDTRGFAIIVYDVSRQRSWRVTHRTMHASPDFGVLCIAGAQFEVMDGIQGMALSPLHQMKDRVLFYHSLASDSEHYILSSELRNNSQSAGSFKTFCGRRSTQSSPMAVSRDGVLFFGLMSHASLNCWDTSMVYAYPFVKNVYSNFTSLQFINGLKIIINNDGKEELWLANTRARRMAGGSSDETTVNFRVQSGDVATIGSKAGCRNTANDIRVNPVSRFQSGTCSVECSEMLSPYELATA